MWNIGKGVKIPSNKQGIKLNLYLSASGEKTDLSGGADIALGCSTCLAYEGPAVWCTGVAGGRKDGRINTVNYKWHILETELQHLF